MNGFITNRMGAVCLAGGLALLGGCDCYRNLVDPCWPERYNYQARQEVCQAFVPQVNNGHILDQTVWNWHFEPGTERLTPGGLKHLSILARRRPCPDPRVFLQTAQDVVYDAGAPEKFALGRTELNAKRVEAIQKYLTAQTADRPMGFDVVVHDPGEVGLSAVEAQGSMQAINTSAVIVDQAIMNVAPGPFPGSVGAGISPVLSGSGGGGGGGGR
jgi:hypothetical protein